MIVLPASIESYLKEAGFSSTEIMILQKLLQEDALTLRELAAKTGKSTGVLDAAAKKLLSKRIVTRDDINEQQKFTLLSLQPIMDWMEKDRKLKQEMLERRHQNFETFVATLKVDKHRPEMQHFEGWDGLKKAYALLLEPQQEMLEYDPVPYKAEDDPLREFKVDYFRERRRRKVFSRILAPDTSLGRRFQSRDPFEFRKTLLLPEGELPSQFHKIIVNGLVACINYQEQRAVFIKYPELAKSERAMFERLWNDAGKLTSPLPAVPVEVVVPIKTRLLSAAREFFLSKASIPSFVLFAVVSAVITGGLYLHTRNLNLQRLKERVISVASTGALQFDTNDINAIWGPEDISKPEYARLIASLNLIRQNNTDVQYAYIMRPTADPAKPMFVADADALDPSLRKDFNGDGIIDEADVLSMPGDVYEDHLPFISDGFEKPITSVGTDKWGTFISGHAPIRDGGGNSVAMLGIDVFANKIDELSNKTLVPLYFLVLFVIFIAVQFAARNRSLFKEMLSLFHLKNVAICLVCCTLISAAITFGMYRYTANLNLQRLRERVMSIAATGSMQLNSADLDQLHTLKDTEKPEYAKIINLLNEMREINKDILYVYIIRPTDQPTMFEFVADADAKDPYAKVDSNKDGKIDNADQLGIPGMQYDVVGKDALIAGDFSQPFANKDTYTDQWGTFITGYAPIKRSDGSLAGLLSVDVWGRQLEELSNKDEMPMYFLGIFFLLITLSFAFLNKHLFRKETKMINLRNLLLMSLVCAFVALGITYAMHLQTLSVLRTQLSEKLMAIAVTAASQFDPKDLEELHFARDMKKESYQRVFKQLNKIKNENEGVRYTFIMRRTDNPEVYEFVADADSNYDIPFLKDDNRDGILNEADEGVAPGVRYVSLLDDYEEGFDKPFTNNEIVTDQWGSFLSGFAPIYNTAGHKEYMLEIDISVDQLYQIAQKKFISRIWFIILFALTLSTYLVLNFALYKASLRKQNK